MCGTSRNDGPGPPRPPANRRRRSRSPDRDLPVRPSGRASDGTEGVFMATATDRRSTQLDRRRDQATAATEAAEKARARVTELDNRLQTNANMTRQQTQAWRNAMAEANRLKRALKTGAKEKERLTKARRKAKARTEKVRAKAEAAEARYEKTVLAEMVRREKERDRADSAQPPAESTSRALQ